MSIVENHRNSKDYVVGMLMTEVWGNSTLFNYCCYFLGAIAQKTLRNYRLQTKFWLRTQTVPALGHPALSLCPCNGTGKLTVWKLKLRRKELASGPRPFGMTLRAVGDLLWLHPRTPCRGKDGQTTKRMPGQSHSLPNPTSSSRRGHIGHPELRNCKSWLTPW